MEPLVSICIPAYNNGAHIHETIQSLLDQTYQTIEIVVVDDASQDDTFEVVQAVDDPRIRLFRNDANLGMAGNWNRCLHLATGDYVKVMGADDLLMPEAIEKEVKALMEHPTAVLAESNSWIMDMDCNKRGIYGRYWRQGLVDGRRVAKSSVRTVDLFGAPLANLFPRSILDRVPGFDPAFVYILDYDFFMSIAALGDIFITHDLLNAQRIRQDSNTSQVMGGGKERAYIAEHRQLLEKHRAGLGLTRFDIALSVLMRRLRSLLVSVFLKLFVRSTGRR